MEGKMVNWESLQLHTARSI